MFFTKINTNIYITESNLFEHKNENGKINETLIFY